MATKKKTATKTKLAAKKKERFVLVTTEFRGVFAGYASDTSGDVIALRGGRNCLYWHQSIGGFAGLAAVGPNAECRIGAAADIELRKITSVAEVTAAAEHVWLTAPVHK